MCDDQGVHTSPPPAPERLPLRRPPSGQRIAGVCLGLAAHLDIDVRHVRLGMIVAALAGGLGFVLYAFLWITVPRGDPWYEGAYHAGSARAAAPLAAPHTPPGPNMAAHPVFATPWWSRIPLRDLAVGAMLVTTAVLLVADRLGAQLQWTLVLSVIVVVIGLVLAWGQLNESQRGTFAATVGGRSPSSLMRVTGGIALVVLGVILILSQEQGPQMLVPALVSAVAVLVGAGLVLAPWWLRLARQLTEERASNARAKERADIAAHLHDSVLQTLALIQRSADQPGEITRLARNQERELRQWLYQETPKEGTSTQEAARDIIATVENDMTAALGGQHPVTIDLVVVGDTPPDPTTHAVLQALAEASKNAVRHGKPPVSVYLEITDTAIDASVTDRGLGFRLDDVPNDRFGVRESIIGRIERRGGIARYRSLAAGGTELRLTVPRTPGATHSPASAHSEKL